MSRHRIVLMVAAVTALAVAAAPGAVATPNDVPGSVVLQGLPGSSWTEAVDINNYGVVIGSSNWAPVRWDSSGRITALPLPPGQVSAGVREITDSGFVLGAGARDNGAVGIPFLWDPRGRLIDMRLPPGSRGTRAEDVNESGTVVGSSTGADGQQHAVRWDSQGGVTVLREPRDATFSSAVAVNNQGATVGYSDVVVAGAHVRHAVFWDAAGWPADLGGPFSTATSEAVDINDAGAIVGVRDGQTLRWNRLGLGRVTVLPPPPNFVSYRPIEMNDSGVVLGQGSTNEMMVDHPIRWDSQGRATDLGGGYHHHTWASELNSGGTVAGTSDDGWHMPGVSRYSAAVMWDRAGTMSQLGALAGDWNSATGINDGGVVCGVSGNTDGSNMHAVLWNRW
jgi:probable HAF family extracellular repeat protein